MRKGKRGFLSLTLMLVCAGAFCAYAAVTVNSATQRVLIIDDNGLKSETALSLANSSAALAAWIKISVPGKTPDIQSLGTLATGTSTKNVYVPELNADNDSVTFEFYNNAGATGTPLGARPMAQRKIKHWKVYVAHDMHLDIGYTNYQETLINQTFPGYQDQNFTYISATNAWAPNDQFRYKAEGSFLYLRSVWNSRSADWIETLKTYLASGRMAYAAGYMHECFEGVGTEQIARFNYFSERFAKDKFGIASTNVLYKSDDPGLSWANVDALAGSGIKYFMMRFNDDRGASQWDITAYPRMFYMQGRVPEHKILAYDGPHYAVDEYAFQNASSTTPYNNIMTTINNGQFTSNYPYDAYVSDFTCASCGYDNAPLNTIVKDNIKAVNALFVDAQGRKCVYPQVASSTIGEFFVHIDSAFSSIIPVFKGTIENWWNWGAASTAYETGLNRLAHEKLPAAESFCTFAAIGAANQKYPYENLYNAWDNMVIYDEHTWGSAAAAVDNQWNWKRNSAITASRLSDNLMAGALAALNTLIPATDRTVVVYNTLSWNRSDVVRVQQDDLPAHFDIIDIESGTAQRYQKLPDNTVIFIAHDVPALGYRCFKAVNRADDPVFPTAVTATATTLENSCYRVTFDATGAVSSIVDKLHSNAELVDATAPYKMNQFIYYTTDQRSFTVRTTNPITTAILSGAGGPLCGTMTANAVPAQGGGASSIKRYVILYDSLTRIDFIDYVGKTDAPTPSTQDEEGFFSFPLNVPNFMLRHEMPTGDVRPRVSSNIYDTTLEQYYSSSTDHYTVNRWVDASDQSAFGITLCPVNAPLVQYGQRRSFMFSKVYNTAKPWVYSYVFNNKWWTNFQETQPGPVTFRYSLQSHTGGDWKTGRADKFGMEVTNELQAAIISGAQAGSGLNGTKGQFISIDNDNVKLTAAKIAEDNGEGMILRFNETMGAETAVTVDLRWFNPTSVTETDIVENDSSAMTVTNGKITFTLKGYQWKTVRCAFGSAPAQVTGVSATMNASGTQIAWSDVADAVSYEVFRGTSASFIPGQGTYFATVSANHCYDGQVKTGLTNGYYYKVRAIKPGAKGPFSNAAQATAGTITDNTPPSAPVGMLDYVWPTRISISWQPSTDNVSVTGYKVYRNGVEIATLPANFNSYLDYSITPGTDYVYTVKAYDEANNLSAASNDICLTPVVKPGNIAPLATITASTAFSTAYAPSKVADGIIGIQDFGEWASRGETNPWLLLTWPSTESINRVVIYDRDNAADNANGGTLTFSDGSSIPVTGIPNDGSAKEITFSPKNVTWVRFQVSGGAGPNVGLSEVEVYRYQATAVLPCSYRPSSPYNLNRSPGNVPGTQPVVPENLVVNPAPLESNGSTAPTVAFQSKRVPYYLSSINAIVSMKAPGGVIESDGILYEGEPAVSAKSNGPGKAASERIIPEDNGVALQGKALLQGHSDNWGVHIFLYTDITGSPVANSITDSKGEYTIYCKDTGSYMLVMEPPAVFKYEYAPHSLPLFVHTSKNIIAAVTLADIMPPQIHIEGENRVVQTLQVGKNETMEISGIIVDEGSGVNGATWRVTLNGKPLSIKQSGYRWSVRVAPLKTDSCIVSLQVCDAAGNKTEKNITLVKKGNFTYLTGTR